MSKNSSNPIICAVDTPDIYHAAALIGELQDSVGAIKLGLEFFTANGAQGVRPLTGHFPVFLDLKFHDIPNTVNKAILATADINTFMMTVHAAGGKAMLKAAADAATELAAITGKDRPLIVGVTVLTSLDQDDLTSVGVNDKLHDQVKRLAELAQSTGLDGVVCSPQEISLLRKLCGDDFILVVPGIRPTGANKGDQKRTMAPKEAIEQGADYLVIGRPITGAENPKSAAQAILSSLRA